MSSWSKIARPRLLIGLIKSHVIPGTTVITDGFKTYGSLASQGSCARGVFQVSQLQVLNLTG